MFSIVVEDEFSAAHFLKLYDGSWEKRHGHNWKVAAELRSETLDSMEVVADFEQVKPALKSVLGELDGLCLNDHPEFKGKKNSSTENIAKLIYDKLSARLTSGQAKLVKVTVWETPGASASYWA